MIAPLSIPSPDPAWQTPIAFSIGSWNIQIHTYAIVIILGILVAVWLTEARLRRRGVEPWAVLDILIWAVPLGIIGARVWHVATHPTDYFPIDGVNHTWLQAIAIWDGGGAIFGSILFGALGVWIGARTLGLRFFTVADALVPGLLLAQAIGRLGNWFNHELFGTPTTLPWGLEIESTNPAYPVGLPEGVTFHPMFLYELLWNLLGAALLLLLDRRFRLQWGKLLALYLIWYGIGRGILENFRLDPSEVYFGLRVNVWGALAAILAGVILFIVQSRRHRGAEPSPYLPGKGPVGEDEDAADDVYTEADFDGSREAQTESDAVVEDAASDEPAADRA